VAGCCEHGNELSVSIKCGEFLDRLLGSQERHCLNELVVSSCIPVVTNSDKDRSSFVRKFQHAEFTM
jgi:hypothetical protein